MRISKNIQHISGSPNGDVWNKQYKTFWENCSTSQIIYRSCYYFFNIFNLEKAMKRVLVGNSFHATIYIIQQFFEKKQSDWL